MNFGFENSKRKVSLGGRSRIAESREEVLRRTHLERQKRAQERLEQKSALHIQAAWRRAAAVDNHKVACRERWTQQFGTDSDRCPEGHALLSALRDVIHFSHAENLTDVRRLAGFGKALLKASGVPDIIKAAAVAAPQNGHTHTLRLSRLLTFCIRSLRLHRATMLPEKSSGTESSTGSALLFIIVRCTDVQLWQRAGPAGPQRLAALCQLLSRPSIFDDLACVLHTACSASEGGSLTRAHDMTAARGGIASTSATGPIMPSKPVDYGRTPAAIAAFVGRWLASSTGRKSNETLRLALTPLLCTPFLWSRCESLRPFAALAWVQASRELAGQSEVIKHLPQDLANGWRGSLTALVGNIAEAASLASTTGTTAVANFEFEEAARGFSDVIDHLLPRLPFETLFPRWSIDHGAQDDVEMADATDATAAAWDGTQMPPVRCAAQIRKLVSPAAVQFLMRILLPAGAEDRPGTPLARDNTRAFCRLLSIPLSTPALRDETRLALAFRPEIVPRLWHAYLKEGFRGGKWSGADDLQTPGYMLPLLLLSHCFSTFLSTSGESSFYDEQRPLRLSEVYTPDEGGLIGLLKHALWQILWVDGTRGKAALAGEEVEIRDAVARAAGMLLGQLYDRNCRRAFVPTEAFYAPQLSEDLFNAEVQSSLAHGAFLEAKRTRVWQVLREAPFLVPFQVRAAVFQRVVSSQRDWDQGRWAFRQPEPIIIRRNHLFWDSFDSLGRIGEGLKDRLRIGFVDVHGMQEAGVDGGGLFKDLMENLVREGFDPQLGLFLATSDNRLYPNPNAGLAMDAAVPAFEFLGKMVGKAMFEGIIVELPLAPFFLKQLLRRGVDVNDLPTLDAEHYRNLMFLRSYEGDVEELSLTFTITQDVYGDRRERELIPGGRDIAVTNTNRAEYILRTANYRLNVETRVYTDAFRRGLEAVIEPEWVSMFNEEELQMLIRGRGAAGIDVSELQRNVNYAGGYDEDHPTIKAFWAALASFSPQQQAAWLKFVTACSRAPLLGFSHLSPPLCIAKAGQEGDPASQERLPTSATCLNLLKLPPMRSPQQIAAKLLYAMENVSGFDLS